MPQKSLVLSLRSIYETLAISWPTVLDAALGRVTKETCDDRLATWASKVVEASKMALEVSGREHLEDHDGTSSASPKRGQHQKAYLVMSNHQSHYDIPVLFYVLGANIRMVAKLELFGLPIFGPAIREAGFIAIDRSNRHRAIESLAVAKKTLESGTNVWIAPEGTRSRDGQLLPFKKGGFVLSLETGWPVLPITIQGTRAILPPKGMRSVPDQKVRVAIHRPIDPARYAGMPEKEKRAAFMRDVRAIIQSAL